MDMRKFSGENFLKVADVQDGPLQRKIAVVREGRFGKPDLIFENGDALSVNATNNKTLMRCYGPDSDGWIGKEVELLFGQIKYQGGLQDAVLIRPDNAEQTKPLSEPEPVAKPKPDYDDDLPEWARKQTG